MLQTWEFYGITDTIRLIQYLYIDHYPFQYKLPFQWVLKHGVVRIEMVKYRTPTVRYLAKLFPLLVNSFAASLCLCCLLIFPRAYLRDSTDIWKDIRFWFWICGGGTTGVFAFVYRLIAFGDEETLLRTADQAIDLEIEMRQGKI